jgi:hypothetical protein
MLGVSRGSPGPCGASSIRASRAPSGGSRSDQVMQRISGDRRRLASENHRFSLSTNEQRAPSVRPEHLRDYALAVHALLAAGRTPADVQPRMPGSKGYASVLGCLGQAGAPLGTASSCRKNRSAATVSRCATAGSVRRAPAESPPPSTPVPPRRTRPPTCPPSSPRLRRAPAAPRRHAAPTDEITQMDGAGRIGGVGGRAGGAPNGSGAPPGGEQHRRRQACGGAGRAAGARADGPRPGGRADR